MVEIVKNQEGLLTSAEAARRLGIAVSTLKRWADEGRIQHVRTAGGHRRFRSNAVEGSGLVSFGSLVDHWIELLLSDADARTVVGELRGLRGESTSWRSTCTQLAEVTRELGRRWVAQHLSIYEEHHATEKLMRAVAHCSDDIPVAPSAPMCVLAVPEREEHCMGLALLEPCLRELGWRTWWVGRKTPATEVAKVVRTRRVSAVALSASANCTDEEYLATVDQIVGSACREMGVPLWLGGSGSWPLSSALSHRLTSLESLVEQARRSP